jgi:hypothetical protein
MSTAPQQKKKSRPTKFFKEIELIFYSPEAGSPLRSMNEIESMRRLAKANVVFKSVGFAGSESDAKAGHSQFGFGVEKLLLRRRGLVQQRRLSRGAGRLRGYNPWRRKAAPTPVVLVSKWLPD